MSDVTSRSGLRSRVVAWGAGLGAALAPVLSMAAPSGGTLPPAARAFLSWGFL